MMVKVNDIKSRISVFLDKYSWVCLLVIFIVFLFSRLFHLDITPAGIHYDEAGMAFDAKSLAVYGTDRHNNSFPFYLPAYGGGQSALYAYTLALMLKIVPFSVFIMRLPAVIYGGLAFFSSYYLVRDMFKDRRWALMGPILVTIIPYFFTSERWALDCNLFLSLATVSFYMYYRAHIKNRYSDYVIAGLTLGITLYTYVLSYVVLPVFLFISVVYLLIIKKLEVKKYVVLAIPLGILALPLLIMQLINMGKLSPFKFLIFDFPKLGFYRGGEMSLAAIPHNLDRLWMMLFRGEQITLNCVPGFNPVYIVMVPLIAGGLIISIVETIRSIKEKTLTVYPFIIAFTIAGYIMVMMITENLNIYTGNELYIMYVLYTVVCMRWLHNRIVKEFQLGIISTPIILASLAVSFLLFSNYYYRHMNADLGVQFMFVSTEYGEVVNFTNENYNPEGKTIYYVRSPKHQSYPEVIIGMFMGADPQKWETNYLDKNMVENVYIGFPENDIDMNEDCLYIFSKETAGHIPPYFAEAGWNVDDHFESYSIVWR